MYEGDTTAASRSMSAFAFGPGSTRCADDRGSVTFASSAYPAASPPGARHARPDRHECDRPPGNRGGAWRLAALQSICSISSTGTGGCSSSFFRSDKMPSTRSNRSNACRMTGRSPVPSCAGIDRRVQVADQIEHRAKRGRGVQVLHHRVREVRLRLVHARRDCRMRPLDGNRLHSRQTIRQAPQRPFRVSRDSPT